MNNPLPAAIFLMGPTASGKTEIAIDLARRFPLEIISVDSALVYRGMDIGTAKPGPEILALAPHRLIDIRDPGEPYSAAEFREDALREMTDITAHGRVPLLVGGTFLYFRVLEQGLSDMPPADADIRARLEAEAATHGWEALHGRLARVDPESAARIHATDPQRIQRALEVYELTGQPMSTFHAEGRASPLPYRVLKLALVPTDRVALHARIEQRFRAMLEAGLVDEVRVLLKSAQLDADLPSMRAVGYRQVRGFLQGETGFDEMVELAITATRQYAKRQLTWLRGEPELEPFPAGAPGLADQIAERLTGWLAS